MFSKRQVQVCFLVAVILINGALTLSSTPQVECFQDSLRLHFFPDGFLHGGQNNNDSFCGHIYVKGFFSLSRCHLDFTQQFVNQPFFFHIPLNGHCQVKRERILAGSQNVSNSSPSSPSGNTESGFQYSVVVIVQHHRFFITERDKAYVVSCFYRDERNSLQNSISVGDLTSDKVSGVDRLLTCSYEILNANNNQTVKFTNIGDQLIHRWTCDVEDMGMLVHSCSVRDSIGNEYALIDEHGCVTDSTLMKPLIYSSSLNESHSPPIGAFKFADQMIVYFKCQVTLCDKIGNGCDGITPPVCNESTSKSSPNLQSITETPIQFIGGRSTMFGNPQFVPPERSEFMDFQRNGAYITTSRLPLLFNENNARSSNGLSGKNRPETTTVRYIEPPVLPPISYIDDQWSNEDKSELINLFSRGRNQPKQTHQRFIKDASYAEQYWNNNPQVQPQSETKYSRYVKQRAPVAPKNYTIDVASDQLIVFTNDEKIKNDGSSENFAMSNQGPNKPQCPNQTEIYWACGILDTKNNLKKFLALFFLLAVCGFVIIFVHFRQVIAALQRQIQCDRQTNYQRRLTTTRTTGTEEPEFKSSPFFELKTFSNNTTTSSNQNLVY